MNSKTLGFFAALSLLGGALMAFASAANAVPINYGLKFTVETGKVFTADFFAAASNPNFLRASEESAVGNVYFGTFGVDSEVLASGGLNRPGDVLFFFIEMEDNIWSYNAFDNLPHNEFGGFRGPRPDSPDCLTCGGAPSPGFDVVDGEITDLTGAMSGLADIPEVAFSNGAPNTFSAIGLALGGAQFFSYVRGGGEGESAITGNMEVYRIPEPATLSLLGAGLVGIFLRRRRKAV